MTRAGLGSSKAELFEAIRRDPQLEELGVRELARRYSVHRRTVRPCGRDRRVGRTERLRRRPETAREGAIRLVDLLDQSRIAGELPTGYKEQSWVARLQPDGSLRLQSATSAIPSSAGRDPARILWANLPRTVAATDGWDFRSTRDLALGDVAKLIEVRRRAARTETGPPRP